MSRQFWSGNVYPHFAHSTYPQCPTVDLPPGMPVPSDLRDFVPIVRTAKASQSAMDSAGEPRLTSDSDANKLSSEDDSARSAVETSSVCSETSETSLPPTPGNE